MLTVDYQLVPFSVSWQPSRTFTQAIFTHKANTFSIKKKKRQYKLDQNIWIFSKLARCFGGL